MTEPVPVSVVIAARDEEAEIVECIESVRWAREIIVVENDSVDRTVEMARAARARVFSHPFTTIGAQRNAAIAQATSDWIFVLDADERATGEFARAVQRVIADGRGPDAYRVRRRNFLLGREIAHGGWERDRPVRVFRSSLRYDERPVHEHVITQGPVGLIPEPILHTPYASLDEYFQKLGTYSRWWAAQHHAAGRRAGLTDLTVRPVARFLTMLVVRGGWRDGPHGVVVAVLGAMSVAAKYAQLWARQRAGR